MARFRTLFGRLRFSADFAIVRCWLSEDGMHAVYEHRRLADLLRKTTWTPKTSALTLAVRDRFSGSALTIILPKNLRADSFSCVSLQWYVLTMPEYDLRSVFPLNERDFPVRDSTWRCRLIEVSDLRPERDRLAWYLSFETDEDSRSASAPVHIRKLEIVTSSEVLNRGFPPNLAERIAEWLSSDEVDGRREWLEAGRKEPLDAEM